MGKHKFSTNRQSIDPMQSLLLALSDDLTLPLLQIRTSAETIEQSDYKKAELKQTNEQILLSAESGLQLIEAYKLTLKITKQLDQYSFEPVAIGAVFQEVAHELSPYAKKYATDLEVDVSGKITPVLTHQPSLHSVIHLLSASLIRAQSSQSKQKKYRILLGAHRTSESTISAGVFSNVDGLSDKALRDARLISGRARQPLVSVPAGAASGVLIADMLCSSLWQPLRAAAHNGMHGLATAIPISKQLSFV